MIAPPSLIYAGALAVGLLASRRYPVAVLRRGVRFKLGWTLLAAGALVGFSGERALHEAGTNVNPARPTTALVVRGPYHFTRNPLYLSLTLVYGGISALANSLWAMLLLPGVLAVMRRGVIEHEERYLEGKFAEEYRRYKARVRRWI